MSGPILPGDLVDLAKTHPGINVVVLGEVHDNRSHHANQALAVAGLLPKAIVFEMLTPDMAARMPQDRSDSALVTAAIGWDGRGWPDFGWYHPILLAAFEAQIYGADIPLIDIRRALSEGAAAVFGGDAAQYGLTLSLPAFDQADREAEQAAAHCGAMPPEALPAMVDVQRLRDAALARAVVQAMAETGGPVA